MSTLNRSRLSTTTTNRASRRSLRGDHISAPHRSAQLIAEAVIAGYIHDLSRGSRRGVRSAKDHLPRPR
jgi:hypothetical protein